MQNTTTRTTAGNPAERLLCRCACAEFDDAAGQAFREACREQEDWGRTIREAELHGMAPWLHMRIRRTEAEVPGDIRRKLAALAYRHADAIRIRTRALLEINEHLDREGIDMLVLKGAALAHLIYPEPGLRPMRDIDVLVAPGHLERASEIVAGLGYQAASGDATRRDHHHLPTVSKTMDRLHVSVEIHHNALTRDNLGSIRLDALSEPPRAFTVDGATLYTLGHLDMLRHLCRHALEPAESTKIGSALDIMLYATQYAGEIDWHRLNREFPDVPTMLQMLGYLVPWPTRLDGLAPAPTDDIPAGVGTGMIPLSRMRHRRDWPRKLLSPSDWWLRAFYNVPVGRSLAYTKAIRHPARVLFWLWRRAGRPGR